MKDIRTMRFVGWIGSLDLCEFCGRRGGAYDRAAILEEKAMLKTRGGLGGGRAGRMVTIKSARQRFACESCIRAAFTFLAVE